MTYTGVSGEERDRDRLIAELASRQYGVFSRAQALEIGIEDVTMLRRVRKGRWDQLYPRVYRLAGSADSWRQRLLAACLAWGPGAIVSHRAAAALWKLLVTTQIFVELTIPRSRKRSLPTMVYRPMAVPSVDVTVYQAIPVTTPVRTLIDLAAVETSDVVEEALDDALGRGLVSLPRLRWRLSETTQRGRAGGPLLRALVEARSDKNAAPKSRFETRVLREINRAGLPAPERQYPVRRGSRVVAVVDFAYPNERVGIEADSYRWHSSRQRFERDLARRNALTALGWHIVHVTWSELRDRPEGVTNAISEALSASR